MDTAHEPQPIDYPPPQLDGEQRQEQAKWAWNITPETDFEDCLEATK